MQSRVGWVGEILILGWEGIIGHASPGGVLTAVMVFNSIMAYSMCRTATRHQMTTVCIFESILLLIWLLGIVVLQVTGTS